MSICFGAPSLTSSQITTAKNVVTQEGNLDDKTFFYLSKSGCRVHKHFILSDIKTSADAYWITPFCKVANDYKNKVTDQTTIANDAGTYQLRMMFAMNYFEKEEFKKVTYEITQGTKAIHPISIKFTPLQTDDQFGLFASIMWYKIGVVMEFNASDIDENADLKVMAKGNGTEAVVFKLHNDKDITKYDTKRHGFQWSPLNDTL